MVFHYHTDIIHKNCTCTFSSETLAMNEIVCIHIFENAIVIIHCETSRRHDGNFFSSTWFFTLFMYEFFTFFFHRHHHVPTFLLLFLFFLTIVEHSRECEHEWKSILILETCSCSSLTAWIEKKSKENECMCVANTKKFIIEKKQQQSCVEGI